MLKLDSLTLHRLMVSELPLIMQEVELSKLLEMHILPSILDTLVLFYSMSMEMRTQSELVHMLVLVLSSHLLVEQRVLQETFQKLQLYSDLQEMVSRRAPIFTSVVVPCLDSFPRQNLQVLRNNQPYSSILKVKLYQEFCSIILVLVHSLHLLVLRKQEQSPSKQVDCSNSMENPKTEEYSHQMLERVLSSHSLEKQKHLLQQTTNSHHHYSRLVEMQPLDSLLVLLVVVDSMFFRKSPDSMLKVRTDLLVLKKEEQLIILLLYYSLLTAPSKSSLSSKKLVVDSPELVEKHSPKLHLDILVVVGLLSTVILLLESRCPRLDLEQSSDSLVEQKQLR